MSGYSTPTNPGSTGHGLSWKMVRVVRLLPDRRTAMVVDQFGKAMEIAYNIMPAKGLRPSTGEDWVIEHKYGRWVFGAVVTGPEGVSVEHVDGLSDALDDIDTSVNELATALDTRLDKHEAPGKHLWRQASNAATTVNAGVNTNYTLTSPFAITTAGIATFSGTTIKFNRAGRWSLLLAVSGGPTTDGSLNPFLSFGTPSAVTADGGFLDSTTDGLGAEGYIADTLSWTGWVTTAQAAVGFTAGVYWSSTANLPLYWTLGLEYLGPF